MRWFCTTSRSVPDLVVEAAAVRDVEVLRHGDLDRLDVAAVPHRFEHGVGEPQPQDLLDRHLPEEVVDPVQLRLAQHRAQRRTQRLGGREVVAERLLDDDPGPVDEVRAGETLDRHLEE